MVYSTLHMETKKYDVVVLGAGSGGLTAAVGFAKVGKKVLLIEKERLGGECTNSGCVPSKALLHAAKDYYRARHIAGTTNELDLYRHDALSYVRRVRDAILDDETPQAFEQHGITVLMGEARFSRPCAVVVGDTEYEYKHAIIATGSSPRPLTIDGLDEEDVLTNQNLFELKEIPKKLLIIGGGPIGMEMGQAFAMLGSEVTIVTIDETFARLEDPAIQPIIEETFLRLGIRILTNAHASHATDGTVHINIKEGDAVTRTEAVAYDKVLIAIGRVPNIPPGTDVAKIKTESYGILVDSQCRTSNRWVYAIGDVADRLKFTHTADDRARQVVEHVVSRGLIRVNNRKAVPKVTYTEPEVAQVGLSYSEATKKYSDAEIMRIEVPLSMNDRARTDSKTEGLLIVIVRRLNGAILGAHMIGPRAGEIIALFTLAIDRKISMWNLRRTIYAYPTYALLVKKAGDLFFSEQMLHLKGDLTALARKHAPKVVALLFWGILIYTFQDYRLSNNLSYQDVLLRLLDFFTTTMWGPLVYMALYAVRPLILFPATLLTALSGALFGFWWGTLYTIIGENASANVAYWIGRFIGKDFRLEDSVIGNWIEALRQRSFETVLFLRLFYAPFDLTNFGSGVVRAKWSEYFFATLIGIMPGLTTFVALGAAVDIETFKMEGLTFNAFDPKFVLLSIGIFIVSFIVSRFLKRWKAASV